jgi:hypothetical protein
MSEKETNLEYQKRARTSPLFYLILTMGVIFTVGGFLIDPATNCVEYPCPAWLRLLASGVGAVFAIGALSSIVRDFRFGSRIVRERGLLIWWEGYPPVEEKVILASDIKTIIIKSDSDNRPIVLLDSQGARVHLSDQCIPSPHREWAYNMKNAFPHIEVRDE